MWPFRKRQKEPKESYKIAFCETPDLSTKFGEWDGLFETYSAADHCIRMGWHDAIKKKENDAYQIDSAWLVIEKVFYIKS